MATKNRLPVVVWSTIDSRWRVTIPFAIRRDFGLRVGDRLIWSVGQDHTIFIKVDPRRRSRRADRHV
jgi:AbrB family looped-hinge helix DNA binding protein